tara:strand:- start:3854 stop:4267 length:414 start_codon:yes stop_codon:yes gene_type:complete
MVIMAFDFGLKNIGIAIGQDISRSSNTFYTLKANNGLPKWKFLDSLVKEWEPNIFVLGNPLNMDGTPSLMKRKSDLFGRRLEERYKIIPELVDERLSSKEALLRQKDLHLRNLTSSGSDIHSISAQIILEDWFREKH